MWENDNSIASISSIPIDISLRQLGFSNFIQRKQQNGFDQILKQSYPMWQHPEKSDTIKKRKMFDSINMMSSLMPNKNSVDMCNNAFNNFNIEIGEVHSESQSYVADNHENNNQMLQKHLNEEGQNKKQGYFFDEEDKMGQIRNSNNIGNKLNTSIQKNGYEEYFPANLAEYLRERQIPIQYVRGLLLIKNIKQLKTKRRIKVQRYLQKRRTKTWNRKIVYNCRQKVADERLRIKGKFIKKRTAMKILDIKVPIPLADLKSKLIEALSNKSDQQIGQILQTAQIIQRQIEVQSSEPSIT